MYQQQDHHLLHLTRPLPHTYTTSENTRSNRITPNKIAPVQWKV